MNDYTRSAVLVGVDDSLNANIAAAWAVAIGRRLGVPVRAVAAWTRVASKALPGVDDDVSEMNTHVASAAAQSLRDVGLDDVDIVARRGPAATVLLDAVNELDASILVVGTRGLGPLSGLLLGSVSRRLLFTTDRPLVLVPRRWTMSPPPLTRILVGVDCSAVARRVLSWSAAFCADLGLPATIVRCADPGCEKPPGHVERFDEDVRADAEEALVQFRDNDVEYKVVVCNTDPRVGLPEAAASDGAGLIVIGSRGAGQFSGLGDTASYLVRHSPLPLAVIP